MIVTRSVPTIALNAACRCSCFQSCASRQALLILQRPRVGGATVGEEIGDARPCIW